MKRPKQPKLVALHFYLLHAAAWQPLNFAPESEATVATELATLLAAGLLECREGVYHITDAGRKRLGSMPV